MSKFDKRLKETLDKWFELHEAIDKEDYIFLKELIYKVEYK